MPPPSSSPYAQYVSDTTSTPCQSYSAQPLAHGTTSSTPTARELTKRSKPGKEELPYAASGSATAAVMSGTTICTHVPDAELLRMAPADALTLRKHQPRTPYKADAWQRALQEAGLLVRFPSIPTGLREGFIVGYPTISRVQSPPNSTTIALYTSEFNDVVNKEISKGRYIGPLLFSDITNLIGPFQTSPLSMIPKPSRLGKFRLIQNFSFPIEVSPCFPSPSINHAIDTALFPCTWGKFSTIYLLISHLPPGSQAATQDVAEAYHTIPLHPSQWPAAVVQISDLQACIDTCVTFGASPSCSAYGRLAGVGVEILRANGIGPLDKWVDDHIFFRIPRTHLHNYNTARLK